MANYVARPRQRKRNEEFECRFARYRRLLHFVAYRLLGDDDEAEMAARATRVKALSDLPNFEHEGEFRSWLFRLLIDEALLLRDTRSVPSSYYSGDKESVDLFDPLPELHMICQNATIEPQS